MQNIVINRKEATRENINEWDVKHMKKLRNHQMKVQTVTQKRMFYNWEKFDLFFNFEWHLA